MKYIDSEKLIAEIGRRKKSIDECPFIEAEFGASIKRDVEIKTLNELISIITSLQQDQPEVELEKEIKNYLATKCAGDDEPSVSEIARHFYALGLDARKEA